MADADTITPFSTDADLLPHEPNVFTDLPLPGQTKLDVTDGVLDGQTVTSAIGWFDQLAAKDVLVMRTGDGVSTTAVVEAVTDANTLTLPTKPFLGPASDLHLLVRTFAPQRRVVAARLAAELRLDANVTVLNADTLVRLEALGTLMLAFRAGLALPVGDEHTEAAIIARAEWYHRSFNYARRAALIELDRDGDGQADATRTLGVIDLVRG